MFIEDGGGAYRPCGGKPDRLDGLLMSVGAGCAGLLAFVFPIASGRIRISKCFSSASFWTKHQDIPGVEGRLKTSGSDVAGTPSVPWIGLVFPEETSPMGPVRKTSKNKETGCKTHPLQLKMGKSQWPAQKIPKTIDIPRNGKISRAWTRSGYVFHKRA